MVSAHLGGGGGGAYARKTIAVTPGSVYTIIAGLAGDNTSGAGSKFIAPDGTTVLALAVNGGNAGYQSGSPGAGGLAADCIADTAYNGGNGAWGSSSKNGGGGGSSAGSSANGNNASVSTGATAPTGGAAGPRPENLLLF